MAAVGEHKGLQRWKMARPVIKVLNDKQIEAVVSSEAKDRDGDIIRVAGWDLGDFLKHPVLLSSHNYGSLRSQIGHWAKMEVKSKRLVGVAEYYVGEGNEEADWGYKLAAKGQAAYSVGFVPDMDKAKEMKGDSDFFPHFEFNGQTLLEVSHVVIPSNAEALQTIKGLKLHPVIGELVDEMLAEGGQPESKDAEWSQIGTLVLSDAQLKRLMDACTAAIKQEIVPIAAALKALQPQVTPTPKKDAYAAGLVAHLKAGQRS